MSMPHKELCLKVIKKAEELGADQSDMIINSSESLNMNAQDKKIDALKVSSSQVVGIRVIKDERIGIAYSESFDEAAITNMITKALENAESMKKSAGEKICAEKNEYIYLCNKENRDLDEKIDLTKKLESEVYKRDKRVKGVPYNGFTESTIEYYYMNSNKTFHFENDFYYSSYTSALVEENGKNSMHYHGSVSREFDNIDINDYVSQSLEHAVNWLDAGPVKTGNYDIIFTPDAFESLKSVFGIIFSAKAIVEKTNPFKDKLNTIITDERLSIKDYPSYPETFFKSYVDSEGFQQAPLDLISNGKLVNFYQNSKTAQQLNMENNFRGSRAARSALAVAGTTQIWNAKGSYNDLRDGQYLEIHSLQGLHSGASAISGDFSFGASGYYCKNGDRIKPIKGITVSGNFYELLKNIKAFGEEVKPTSSYSFFAPLIRFSDMSVAGA